MPDDAPNPRPRRVDLGHGGTPSAAFFAAIPVYFLTVCAENRDSSPLLPAADGILAAARDFHGRGNWFLRLLLVMPDHVHLLASFPRTAVMSATVGNWKRYLARHDGIRWQRNFFDHRIRSAAELSEKWEYIRMNPVRKGLVESPDDWPHWTAFDPATGTRIR